MSLITSNTTPTQTNFSIRTPITPYVPNRAQPLQSGVANTDSMGATSTNIPASAVLGHTIVVAPTAVGQTFTLPTAASLLYEFGRSIDTGVTKTSAGKMLVLNIVNKGTAAAYIASNSTGGDGSAIIALQGGIANATEPSFTGSVTPLGRITPLYIEWRQVNSGVNGATGLYTIYN